MRKTKQILMLAAGVIASVMTAQANLVVNGSFEDLGSGSFSGGWNLFNSVPGWSVGTGSQATQLEIGLGSLYGVSGYHLNNVMELDTTANVRAQQSVAMPNAPLKVSFLYALRNSSQAAGSGLRVSYGTTSYEFYPTSPAMTAFSFIVNGTGNTDDLKFEGLGPSNSYGVLIDDVSVVAVPEPSTYFAAALLGLPLVVSAVRSRMVKTA